MLKKYILVPLSWQPFAKWPHFCVSDSFWSQEHSCPGTAPTKTVKTFAQTLRNWQCLTNHWEISFFALLSLMSSNAFVATISLEVVKMFVLIRRFVQWGNLQGFNLITSVKVLPIRRAHCKWEWWERDSVTSLGGSKKIIYGNSILRKSLSFDAFFMDNFRANGDLEGKPNCLKVGCLSASILLLMKIDLNHESGIWSNAIQGFWPLCDN